MNKAWGGMAACRQRPCTYLEMKSGKAGEKLKLERWAQTKYEEHSVPARELFLFPLSPRKSTIK